MILAHLTNGMLLAALMSWFLPIRKLTPATRWMLLSIPFTLPFIPLGNITLNGFMFTITGQLSITTLALLATCVSGCYFQAKMLDHKERRLMLWGIAALSPGYYLMALGYGPFDPYSLGFPGGSTVYALIALALLSWGGRLYGIALTLALMVVAPVIPLAESTNVGDYLVDVWLAIYALIWALSGILRKLYLAKTMTIHTTNDTYLK